MEIQLRQYVPKQQLFCSLIIVFHICVGHTISVLRQVCILEMIKSVCIVRFDVRGDCLFVNDNSNDFSFFQFMTNPAILSLFYKKGLGMCCPVRKLK